MLVEDFNIRQLNENDRDDYISLFNSNNKLLTLKKTELFSKAMIDQLEKDLVMKEKMVIGAFYNNELMCSTSGYFPENLQYWFSHNQFSNFKKNDLNNYKLSILVWSKCIYKIMEYAEHNQYFSFYARRPIKHQLALEKVQKKLAAEGLIENKYKCFYEAIYKENQPCRFRLHSFYFPEYRKTVEIETVICLYTLKQENRLKFLNINY